MVIVVFFSNERKEVQIGKEGIIIIIHSSLR